MPFITWNDKYSVGIKNIDNQHQRLVEILNELHEAMKNGKGKEIIHSTIDKLVDYTVYHFSLEEKYLNQYSYPEFKKHQATHQEFVNKIKEYQTSITNGTTPVTIELIGFLRDWILKHVQGMDKDYSPFLISKGVR
jgi:hemerythrin